MRRYLLIIVGVLIVCAMGLAIAKWRSDRAAQRTPEQAAASQAEAGDTVQPVSYARKVFDLPYEPVTVQPQVAPYTVKPDLGNVANAKRFGAFTPEQKALLAKNGFFASPTDREQFFPIYDENRYLGIPSFITTDSVLQLYHVFFDFTLRSIESSTLYDLLVALSDAMAAESRTVTKQVTAADWKRAAEMNEVYFAVPSRLLGKDTELATPEQKRVLASELELVTKTRNRTHSPLMECTPDYSQFIPRGHYTRSERLTRFFETMMWYGYMPFATQWDEAEVSANPAWKQIRQSLLITLMLYKAQIDGKPAIETWRRIYEPTVFFVGAADDLTPHDYKAIIDKVYGRNATYADLQDEAKLEQVYQEITKLPMPRIEVQLVGLPPRRTFKLMGQRYIPDSEAMQRLVEWPQRPWPKGLDVMAVLGSERAGDILDNVYKEPEKWDEYLPGRSKLVSEFRATPTDTWQSNLYWGWLWALDSLIDVPGPGYPSFMTNQAWLDKSLNTSLASWAELRHDTILYGKQSAAEGAMEQEEPLPKDYVEPNVEFYNRLLWLTQATRTGLGDRGLMTKDLQSKFERFEDLIGFLRGIAVKELANQQITKEDYGRLRFYGPTLEQLTLSAVEDGLRYWFEITSETDRNIAVIADVHTSQDQCLEEGVGHPYEIFVVVPIEGKLYLTRGAVFSYHEFTHPLTDRLTDEKWQKMLKEGTAPKPPVWTASFVTGKKAEIPTPAGG
jgi:hypothetical protein